MELCRGKLPLPSDIGQEKNSGLNSPMNDREAIKFEKQPMEFGAHKDEEIGLVDPEYLVWLVEGNDFITKLRRYVKSQRFKKRMEET